MDWELIWSSRSLFARATLITVRLFVGALVFGTLLGLIIALLRSWAPKWIAHIIGAYVWLARGTPVLVVLFFTFYGAPSLGLKISPEVAAVIGLSLTAAAYKAEIFRGGLLGVDPGQHEAALALGMGKGHLFRRIVFPQAARIALPPFASNSILLLKATSLSSIITVREITGIGRQLVNSTFRPIEYFSVIAMIYLALISVIVLLEGFLAKIMELKT